MTGTCVQCGRENTTSGPRCSGCGHRYYGHGDIHPTRPTPRATSDLCAVDGCGRSRRNFVVFSGRSAGRRASSLYCEHHLKVGRRAMEDRVIPGIDRFRSAPPPTVTSE